MGFLLLPKLLRSFVWLVIMLFLSNMIAISEKKKKKKNRGEITVELSMSASISKACSKVPLGNLYNRWPIKLKLIRKG